jgi:hypothetical protein
MTCTYTRTFHSSSNETTKLHQKALQIPHQQTSRADPHGPPLHREEEVGTLPVPAVARGLRAPVRAARVRGVPPGRVVAAAAAASGADSRQAP